MSAPSLHRRQRLRAGAQRRLGELRAAGEQPHERLVVRDARAEPAELVAAISFASRSNASATSNSPRIACSDASGLSVQARATGLTLSCVAKSLAAADRVVHRRRSEHRCRRAPADDPEPLAARPRRTLRRAPRRRRRAPPVRGPIDVRRAETRPGTGRADPLRARAGAERPPRRGRPRSMPMLVSSSSRTNSRSISRPCLHRRRHGASRSRRRARSSSSVRARLEQRRAEGRQQRAAVRRSARADRTL